MSGRARVAHVTTIDLTLRHLLLDQLRALRDHGYEVTAISAPGPAARDVEEEGIRHVPWPHATRSWDPGADRRAYRALAEILGGERFDVVHTHNPKPGVMGRVAARRAGVPCVVNTVHGLYATPDDSIVRRTSVLAVERFAARFSDLELYQSEEDLRWARRVGVVGTGKSVLLGNGVDLERFRPGAVPPQRVAEVRAELGIAPDAVVVGTVGRLVAEKGYRELFAAARAVRAARPEVRFVAVGPADVGKADAIGAEELDRARRDVILPGWRGDVRDVLAAMDVFVLASWREGVPRSAIEAAAMGKPLVVTDIRGCREVVRDGREGILVSRGDPGALTAAIRTIVEDGALRSRMGDAARERAEDRFDVRTVIGVLLEQYDRLLRERGIVGRAVEVEGAGAVRIRRARPDDAPTLARLHRQGIATAFLPLLGERFMDLLYRAFTEDPAGVTVVAERDGTVIGYANGVLSMSGFYRRFLRRYGVRAAAVSAPRLVRPDVWRRVLETARYPQDARGLPEAEWVAVVVDPGVRSRRLGELLGRGVLEGLADLGADRVKATVAADNPAINRVLTRMGFRQAATITLHDGRPSNLYVIPTSPPSDRDRVVPRSQP